MHSLRSLEDDMKQCAIMLVFAYAVVTLFTVTPLAAETLNADNLKKILVDRIWAEKGMAGPAENYWEWKADGSVCVRMFEKTGSCDDVGRWKLEADRVCYKLGWWGSDSGETSKCVRISEPTTGRYETLDDYNVPVFEFTVLD